ncbi:MAG: AAA family ATPase [Candidatus Nomurabacteria bacterium]|nr:AAA family ATPase [Candidatus Nomurabacteria bacterium]
MFITKIIINEKHPLIDKCEIDFSLPDKEKEGSGINFIVGKSGAGKTAFLQVITFRDNSPLAKIDNSITVSASQLFDENNLEINKLIRFGYFTDKNISLLQKDYLSNSEEQEEVLSNGGLQKKLIAKDRFNRLYPKTVTNCGTGEAKFGILMHEIGEAYVDKPRHYDIYYIEEPEAYLDPNTQIRLLKELAELAKTKQIFITTHSPYFIDWSYLENGASIIKLNKNEQGNESFVGGFKNPDTAKLINKPGGRRPHLNGVETKNIFFSNKVFILEGQEDVGLISRYLNNSKIECDFTFFGYGAGGASKIEKILDLCHDLKIPKISVLFDNDDEGNIHYKKCKEKYPSQYQIEKLLAEDIRDKYGEKPKIGAFSFNEKTGECSLEPKSNKYGDDFREKIKSVIDYFNK